MLFAMLVMTQLPKYSLLFGILLSKILLLTSPNQIPR